MQCIIFLLYDGDKSSFLAVTSRLRWFHNVYARRVHLDFGFGFVGLAGFARGYSSLRARRLFLFDLHDDSYISQYSFMALGMKKSQPIRFYQFINPALLFQSTSAIFENQSRQKGDRLHHRIFAEPPLISCANPLHGVFLPPYNEVVCTWDSSVAHDAADCSLREQSLILHAICKAPCSPR